jgi:hypothetical protein
MQLGFLAAGVLAAITGAVHSLLGERLIFRHLRHGTLVPTLEAPPLRERHVRILWATWHIGSVFGWAFAGVLLALAFAPAGDPVGPLVLKAAIAGYLGSALLVLVGTKGRHPGWIALLSVAALTAAAATSA